jgi:hypothetical protein
VAGAYRPAVEYIKGQISQRHDLEYPEATSRGCWTWESNIWRPLEQLEIR